jgi:thiol:disulfide interchange protein DsbD
MKRALRDERRPPGAICTVRKESRASRRNLVRIDGVASVKLHTQRISTVMSVRRLFRRSRGGTPALSLEGLSLVGALLAGMLLAGGTARAQSFSGSSSGFGGPEDASPHSNARLVSEVQSVQPGEPFTVALRMTMRENWHSYWINPGDSGQPTRINWALPEGFAADSIQWPHPERLPVGPLTNYGYSNEVFLLTQITPPANLEPGTRVTLGGTAKWLICEEKCLPAQTELHLTLPVKANAPAPNERWQDAFARSRAAQPKALPGWDVKATRGSGSYALEVTPPDGRDVSPSGAYFFSSDKPVIDHAAPQPVSRADGGSFLIGLQQSEYAQEPATRLRGALVAPEGEAWGPDGDVQALRVNVPVDTAGASAAATSATGNDAGGGMTLAWALLFAFAGGVILNLMPCVFPILSIKVLNFAEHAGEENASPRRHGLAFGAGVVASFWVLAGLLLVLRAGGSQIGWGFQLQSPLFIALMAMLFFGIGLNLLGVFDVGHSLMSWGGSVEGAEAGASYGGSFLSGVLATAVATPCTAPLMGAALGFAISLSAGAALAVFTALGAGMAAPYVLLSMAPGLVERMPRPGAWMETLRQGLAFPMLATAVWLVWVFGQQAGVNGITMLLGALLLLSVAAWLVGRWDANRVSGRVRLFTRGLATVAFLGAVAVALVGARYDAPSAAGAAVTEAARNANAWQPFSPQKVEQLRAEGRPVFVDFTAAWCLSCQVNKRTTLSAPAVQNAFDEKEVALLRADWTNRDPEITKALESHGRNGVPLYVLYKGDGSAPRILPEILTQDIVLSALDRLPENDSAASPEGGVATR